MRGSEPRSALVTGSFNRNGAMNTLESGLNAPTTARRVWLANDIDAKLKSSPRRKMPKPTSHKLRRMDLSYTKIKRGNREAGARKRSPHDFCCSRGSSALRRWDSRITFMPKLMDTADTMARRQPNSHCGIIDTAFWWERPPSRVPAVDSVPLFPVYSSVCISGSLLVTSWGLPRSSWASQLQTWSLGALLQASTLGLSQCVPVENAG